MTKKDSAILRSLSMKMHFHLNAEPNYLLVHVNDDLRFSRTVVTPRATMIGKVTYAVEGVDRELTDINQLVAALKEVKRWPKKPLVPPLTRTPTDEEVAHGRTLEPLARACLARTEAPCAPAPRLTSPDEEAQP
jgi:hypothetical protein